MDVINFVGTFNLFKPTIQEIIQTKNSLSTKVLSEIYDEYDLRIVSMEIVSDLLLNLIINTNISELSFSAFHFKKPITNGILLEIGSLEEKGIIFFDPINHNVNFKSYETFGKSAETVGQIDFVKFLLKFWEFDFNRIFRNSKALVYTKNISFDSSTEKFPIMEVLLNEIGLTISDL